MRTKTQLQQATQQNITTVLAEARARNWTDASIAKYGNAVVLAALTGAPAEVKPKRTTVKAQQTATVKYRAEPRKLKPQAPVFKEQGRVPVILTRDSERTEALLVVGTPRKKLVGTGTTTDARISVGDATEKFTMSAQQIQNLLEGGTRVWFKGKSYIATIAQA